jgi:hypothetical protein
MRNIRQGDLLVALSLFFVDIQLTGADLTPPKRAHAMAWSPGTDVGTQGRTATLAVVLICPDGGSVNAYLQQTGNQVAPDALAAIGASPTVVAQPSQFGLSLVMVKP